MSCRVVALEAFLVSDGACRKDFKRQVVRVGAAAHLQEVSIFSLARDCCVSPVIHNRFGVATVGLYTFGFMPHVSRSQLALFLGFSLGELVTLDLCERVGVGADVERQRRESKAMIGNELRRVGCDLALAECSTAAVRVELQSYVASRPAAEQQLFGVGEALKRYFGLRILETRLDVAFQTRVAARNSGDEALRQAAILASACPHADFIKAALRTIDDDDDWFQRLVALEEALMRRLGSVVSLGDSVDVAIITMRDDELTAVLRHFPTTQAPVSGAREYNICQLSASEGSYTVAILRTVRQGNLDAGDAARDLLLELPPRLLLVVGIAGGRPDDEFTLGDVVVSTYVHDFSLEARQYGQRSTFDDMGGPVQRQLAAFVSNLAARELGDWNAPESVGDRPNITVDEQSFTGPPDWQKRVRSSLDRHFPAARAPKLVVGPIASSDNLVKDPDLLIQWLGSARSILAVEMESAGAYHACDDRVPFLAIRGISDIVGFKRDAAWTAFACQTAAAAARAILRLQPLKL